jgi:lipid A ethanolaminephosphotransferase
MNSYATIINTDMIRNMLQTDLHESLDLFSVKLVLYFLILGVIPAYFVYKINLVKHNFKTELASKLKLFGLSILIIAGNIFIFSKHYTSFFREHKALRYSTNPTYWIYSISKYISDSIDDGVIIIKPLGVNARIEKNDGVNKLVILVVGETARADHFSLNGYEKETNPLLKQQDIINFTNMYSCGTSTAVSVPCMFSVYDRKDYSYKKGASTENVLDVLAHTNYVNILWRDNNSDSKGVALRVTYEDYKYSDMNTICDKRECRDEGMLVGLDDYIQKHKGEDILIVLHQLGNHGPAYYKRYPKEFERFTPICKTNQLEECSKEEISNAYDNALLYTDYFLSKTIDSLKKYDKTHMTAMIYMSDHGESLGKNGIYLHGLPYFMAPDAQTHVGSLIWLGNNMKNKIDFKKLNSKKDNKYTHDNLFHILLGIFDVKDDSYKQEMDFLYNK